MTADSSCSSDGLARVVRTVLFMDLVESCRLIQDNEVEAAGRWRRYKAHIENDIVPAHRGRLIRTEGDGLMVTFVELRDALAATFAIQRASSETNAGLPAATHMLLRMGLHVTELYEDERDVYGRGVNLAARLYTLAGPGEIVVSAQVRDQLTPELDADIEDLGQCHLKHFDQPVRAYRIGPPGPRPVIEPGSAFLPDLRPTIAVIPFASRGGEAQQQVLGEVMADEIISSLSRTAELQVISRLSTTTFRERDATLDEISAFLGARYVLSGAYRSSGDQVVLVVELAEARSRHILWTQSVKGRATHIMLGEDELIDRIVAEVSGAIIDRELQRARSQALPSLASSTLLMSAIVLMHRGVSHDFHRARDMLEALIERAQRQALPHAWLGKWHVLRFNRGWTDDRAGQAQAALDCTRRALDADADCSLALTIDGFVHTNLLKQLDVGQRRYERALEVNPNDSLAWLLKGTLLAFEGEGEQAVDATERALRLSPLDPLRYFYESLGATAALSAGRYERAVELAQRSLRVNRTNTSTLRALAIAQALLGDLEAARQTVQEVLLLDPSLTVKSYLDRSPSGAYETGKIWSEALRQAGLPA
ncbi:tetratricopeptide repeat protein [Paraburkholderia phymatum]|uniref:Tetratricopeptide TPR_4 n=1 Tax=Paraburkholderia phymatum (strain DSM 17167 / CIP 108236 / LMG 21445 / STM815) TaxID=391038 RepID=B2JV68_PARP8|nr:tetratricopeptide repeat protein [Paraburkholderia phymatum]ACC74845.1 Tetratricopeptide TPR_4 [Paraburkholderia phymatum STM815]